MLVEMAHREYEHFMTADSKNGTMSLFRTQPVQKLPDRERETIILRSYGKPIGISFQRGECCFKTVKPLNRLIR